MTLSARDTFKFGVLVGLGGIFIDASIAHGLFWDNDPYWTYWITKSFLIATVFTIGTAFLGIGLWQGLAITAVHTLVLEVYYEWLAPVGLPQEPEWLDFNHLWTTGVPVHYLSILIGYLLALWIWRRNAGVARRDADAPAGGARGATLAALLATAGLLLLDGLLTQALLLGQFPGITYFVQHLLVGFVFVYAWLVYVGTSGAAWAVGALMLALLWTTYGMYLAPQGLPFDPPRYLGYDALWLRTLPGDLVSALVVFFLLDRMRARRRLPTLPLAAIALLALGVPDARAEPAKATASVAGHGMLVVGPNPVDMRSTVPLDGFLRLAVTEGGNRWSHVQNTDAMYVLSEFEAHGARWRVEVDRTMPRHPLGSYTTWNGVVFDHEMHGDTGIGTAKLPKMKPDIALYGWAKVWRDGELIDPMAFTHVMVSSRPPMQGVMLEVETEEKALLGAPGGYLTAMWHEVDALQMPRDEMKRRELLGWVALVLLTLGFGWLAWRGAGMNRPSGRD